MITFNVRIVGRDDMLEPMRKRMERLTFMLSDEEVEEKADELCAALAAEFKCENQGSGLNPVFVFGKEAPKKKKKAPKKKVSKSKPKKKSKSNFTKSAGLLF